MSRGQQSNRDFLTWEPVPSKRQVSLITTTVQTELLAELDAMIRQNMQCHARAVVHRYGALGLPAEAVFDLLLSYAVSEDGALHAEKYYQTCRNEFNRTRPAFRWRHLTALARVTASEFGRPAPGQAEAPELLARLYGFVSGREGQAQAESMPEALCRVSSHSLSGMLSATMPEPTWKVISSSRCTAVRMAMLHWLCPPKPK